jgi:hypothetical protein
VKNHINKKKINLDISSIFHENISEESTRKYHINKNKNQALISRIG